MPRFSTAALKDAIIHISHISEKAELPVRFAAEELQRYVQRMTGVRVAIVQVTSSGTHAALVLGPQDAQAGTPASPGPESFEIMPEATRITLAGGSPRALLDAVYALLEQFGCRWSLHGPSEEIVPRLDAPGIELAPIRHTAPFRVRGYCSDIMTWHYTQPEHLHDRLDDDRAFIDWMGKSGANAFFYIRHPFDTQLTIPELSPEFARRGIDVEYGGHVLPLLLPRELFQDHPEYFPQSPDGVRTEYGNLCTSNAAALATASANAVQYVHDYPEMSAIHIWGADLWKGGWCHCAACVAVSVQDQSLRVCNAVARGLAEAGVPRPVCYLAYHDTIQPELTLKPDANVVAEFAPRERCYGHALNDLECATNRRYAAALERYVELFDRRVRLFEYYGDAILFFGCAVPLTRVIAADLDYYQRLGIRDVLMLQFGAFSQWAYPLNFVTFANRVAGRRDASAYCARFGGDAGEAAAVLTELEDIMRQVATYGDIRRPPRARDAAARALARLEAAVPRLVALAQRLERFDDERLAAQGALVRYTRNVLDGVCEEMRSRLAGHPSTADARYAEALQIIAAVDRRFKGLWGSVDLTIIHSLFGAAAFVE